MTFEEKINLVRRNYLKKHGRWPQELIVPHSEEFNVDCGALSGTLLSEINTHGVTAVIVSWAGTPVRWADVPEIVAR